jgi:hypothetical protein
VGYLQEGKKGFKFFKNSLFGIWAFAFQLLLTISNRSIRFRKPRFASLFDSTVTYNIAFKQPLLMKKNTFPCQSGADQCTVSANTTGGVPYMTIDRKRRTGTLGWRFWNVELIGGGGCSRFPSKVFCIFFGRVIVCWLLLCLCRQFRIFERCLDSNSESCRSKQARYQLSHPSLPYLATHLLLSHPSPNVAILSPSKVTKVYVKMSNATCITRAGDVRLDGGGGGGDPIY